VTAGGRHWPARGPDTLPRWLDRRRGLPPLAPFLHAAARQTAEPATATRVPRARTRTTVPPPFPPWSDSLLRAGLVLVGIAVLGVPLLLMAWVRSPQITGERDPIA